MKRKVPPLLVVGICLILASLCAMLYFGIRLHLGAQKSKEIASQMVELLPERTTGVPGIYPNSGMPVLEIEGSDYVALLEVPAFGVTLPVADNWNSNELHAAPRRFCGSAYDNSLVIGGADSPGQFSFCGKIDNGAVITVTDMTGAQFCYVVTRVDRAEHAGAEWLMDDDYDLVLFCRDTYSFQYIAVRCVLSAK